MILQRSISKPDKLYIEHTNYIELHVECTVLLIYGTCNWIVFIFKWIS